MKIKYLILLSIFAASCSTQQKSIKNSTSQKIEFKSLDEFKSDTLNYIVYNFLERKNQYIGKPASLIFDNLQYEINSYNPVYNDGGNMIYSICLSHFDWNKTSHKTSVREKIELLFIDFDYIPVDSIKQFNSKRRIDPSWTPELKAFFGKQTVKNISCLALPNQINRELNKDPNQKPYVPGYNIVP